MGVLMSRVSVVPILAVWAAFSALSLPGAVTHGGEIQAQDVDGRPVAVNGFGRCTVVMYTNPDLEDTSRKVTVALDSYRSRSDFALVRVIDFRGGVPPAMRSIVRVQIRKEIVRENNRLKKAGVAAAPNDAPIIPDFSGSTLNALGWSDTYEQVHMVVFDRHGHEYKRLESVTDPSAVTKIVDSVL